MVAFEHFSYSVLPVGFSKKKKKCKKKPHHFPQETQFEEKKALLSDYIMHKMLICLP